MADNLIDLDASVFETCTAHPQIQKIMSQIGFNEILEPGRLETMGRYMTIRLGSQHKSVPLNTIVDAFHAAGFSVKGVDPDATAPGSQDAQSEPTSGRHDAPNQPSHDDGVTAAGTDESDAAAGAAARTTTSEERGQALRGFLERLQAGEPVERVKADFAAAFQGVDAAEIARAEQMLINAGTPVADVQRLCDVHATLFEDNINPAGVCEALADPDADPFETPGHPLHTFRRENAALQKFVANRIQPLIAKLRSGQDVLALLQEATSEFLKNLTFHYQRKEDLFFPHLENHNINGPSKVMWGLDDENRAALKEALAALREEDPVRAVETLTEALKHVDAMVFKEENILEPMLADTLNAREWRDIAVDSEDYDYALIEQPPRWRPSMVALAEAAVEEAKSLDTKAESSRDAAGVMGVGLANGSAGSTAAASVPIANADTAAGTAVAQAPAPIPGAPVSGLGVQMAVNADGMPQVSIQLPTGSFGIGQLVAVLDTLPLEMTFVDANNVVRYFNHGDSRTFARPKSCLGRDVMNCHPPKSVPVVRGILDDFRSGKRSQVAYWMHLGEKFVYIRYFAVRDANGAYLGALEVTQDIAPIQALEGENRRGQNAS